MIRSVLRSLHVAERARNECVLIFLAELKYAHCILYIQNGRELFALAQGNIVRLSHAMRHDHVVHIHTHILGYAMETEMSTLFGRVGGSLCV